MSGLLFFNISRDQGENEITLYMPRAEIRGSGLGGGRLVGTTSTAFPMQARKVLHRPKEMKVEVAEKFWRADMFQG